MKNNTLRKIVGAIVFVGGGVIVTQMPQHMSSLWLAIFIIFLGLCVSGVGVSIWKGEWPFGKCGDSGKEIGRDGRGKAGEDGAETGGDTKGIS